MYRKIYSHANSIRVMVLMMMMMMMIVYLPCFRRAGGQYPTSLLMLLVVTVVLLLLLKKMKVPRPSEHPPVKNVNLSHITACKESGPWSHRKIRLARREVGNKCCLYKHFVVAAKK